MDCLRMVVGLSRMGSLMGMSYKTEAKDNLLFMIAKSLFSSSSG